MSQTTVKLHSPFMIFPEISSRYKPQRCLTFLLLPYKAYVRNPDRALRHTHRHFTLTVLPRSSPGEKRSWDWEVDVGHIFQQIHQVANIQLCSVVKSSLTWELLEWEDGFFLLFFWLTLHRMGIHYVFLFWFFCIIFALFHQSPAVGGRHGERDTSEPLFRAMKVHMTLCSLFPQDRAVWLGKLPIILHVAAIAKAMRCAWTEFASRRARTCGRG